mmetsp:Transcript_14326/g.32960  ORF Transcript_14326/g.32960 Transcript_14326/m.32960 type:complete len:211 (-) Transcript_14326:288-920(-)
MNSPKCMMHCESCHSGAVGSKLKSRRNSSRIAIGSTKKSRHAMWEVKLKFRSAVRNQSRSLAALMARMLGKRFPVSGSRSSSRSSLASGGSSDMPAFKNWTLFTFFKFTCCVTSLAAATSCCFSRCHWAGWCHKPCLVALTRHKKPPLRHRPQDMLPSRQKGEGASSLLVSTRYPGTNSQRHLLGSRSRSLELLTCSMKGVGDSSHCEWM